MPLFKIRGVDLPEGEYGIPPADPKQPAHRGKARWGMAGLVTTPTQSASEVGRGRAVNAGGMVYVSGVGPVKLETGEVASGDLKLQTRQCMENLKATLEDHGSSLDEIVWANWALRNSSEFDQFYEEWLRWFPDEAPVGQGTLMPLSQRRAGFRISVGVIAAAQAASPPGDTETARIPAVIPVQRSEGAAAPAPPEQAPAGVASESDTPTS
jgi:2-iminobutanoate/2-iminopropanoate deaminase